MAIDLGDIPTGTPPTAGEKLQIRSAIGVGQTDAPTFLAQTLTGQSLTGTQATSLVDLAATWNTTGTPSAIKLNVTDTASNAASNLLDLQVGGGSLFTVTKGGFATFTGPGYAIGALGTHLVFGATTNIYAALDSNFGTDQGGFKVSSIGFFGWSNVAGAQNTADIKLYRDAAGILAQRNGVNAQAFRVANSVGASPLVDYDRGVFDFKTTTNTLRIGTENGGTYTTARPIQFVIGGTACATISSLGLVSISGALAGTYDNVLSLPGGVEFRKDGAATLANVAFTGGTQLYISTNSFKFGSAGMIGFTSASGISNVFDAAFSRNAPGVIEVNTGTAGTYGFLKAKLQTSTAYTATVVTPTGFLTLYDSTGTAYRVPCVV